MAPSARRPNFVVFLTDDQGYGDLSCMGAPDFRTPHLDRVAASGVRFTDWYSNSPVCSPSRASLLTGRYPGNAGVRAILAGHRTASGLPAQVPTLATALRALGYRTALFGKWHLGLAEGSRPQDHGFEEWFGFMAGCVDYYSHIFYWGLSGGTNPLHDLWENGREAWCNGRYLTEMITERAVQYIRRVTGGEEPFFLYLPYNAPHYPMHAPTEYMDRFAHLPWDRRVMAAMIGAVDDGVGVVTAELERQGILENTCIFFTSDNGPSRESRNWLDGNPDPYYGGSVGSLKGHKFSLFEGGIRVPAIMSWPAGIPAGRILDGPAASMDLFPTLLRAAGGDPTAYELDGSELWGALTGTEGLPERDIYWEMNAQTAVRRGRYKLVLNGQLLEGDPSVDSVFLADLEADPGERRNLTARLPEVAADMKARAEAWREVIEDRWQRQWSAGATGTTGVPGPAAGARP